MEAVKLDWWLEVVRGRDVGRRFPVEGASSVLGVGAEAGIDLGEQETGNLKRMAARQARIERGAGGLSVFDLESPGGTFVNRKRVLAGSAQALSEGDVIQVGGVQLRVVRGGQAGRVAVDGVVYALPSGEVCRTFDDVLTLSAQRWAALRDELTAGRLAAHLARTGRAEMAPDPDAPGSGDERLDAWLRSLPTTKPCRPELDVHPARVVVRNTSGGSTRRAVRITNTGYGLLTYRVNSDEAWIRVVGGSGVERTIVESGEIVLEIEFPEDLAERKRGTCSVESNGGRAQIKVEIEPAVVGDGAPQGPLEASENEAARVGLSSWTLSKRVGTLVVLLIAARLVVALSTWILGADSGPLTPLWPSSAVFAGLGAILGVWWSRRGLPIGDRVAVVVASSISGLMGSAVVVAVSRTAEALLPGSGMVYTGLVMAEWVVMAVVLAVGSMWLVPGPGREERGG